MGRKSLLALAAVAVLSCAEAGRGNIVMSLVQIAASPSSPQAIALAASGWTCFLVVGTADNASITTAGWDFHTPASTPANPNSNKTGKDWGIFALSGGIAQGWTIDSDSGQRLQTNLGAPGTVAGGAVSADSFFFTSPDFNQPVGPVEDNNLANGTNPPYNRNPLADTVTTDYGVGTVMRAAAGVQHLAQVKTQTIAQVWVSPGTVLRISGEFADGTAQAVLSPVDVTVTLPEPGTGILLWMGAWGLVARRKLNTKTRRARKGMARDDMDGHELNNRV
jgi:hypothetical protein